MTILDVNGNPIDMAALREPQTAHVGFLQREFDEHPARGLTPAKLHTILVEAEQGDLMRQLELADDIEERDGHIYAELAKRKGAISVLEWTLQEPKNASAEEKSLTAEIAEWLDSIADFEDVLLGMMDAVLKGFANHEMVWELQEKVLLPQLTFRPQRWFTLDVETRSELRLRNLLPGGEPLLPFAWLSHVHRSRNGYLARSSLTRVLAWPYLFKNYSVRDLAELLEIWGLPLRVGKYPSGASDEEKRRLLQAVVQLGHNAAGIMPAGMSIDIINAAQGSQAPFDSMSDRMEAIASKVILGQTLTAGEGKHGTQALGTVHNEVRMDIRNADARQVASTINRQLIHPLAVLNKPGADPRRLPQLVFDTGEPEDMAAYADSLPKLAQAGLQIPVDWVQKRLRIPEPQNNEPVLQAPPPPAPPGVVPADASPPPAAKKPPPKPAALAGQVASGAQVPDAIDELVAEATADWRPLLAPMVDPLLGELDAAIAAGQSLAAFRDRLPELLERMDSQALAERLARANFVARLAGEADLDLNRNEQ